MRPAPEVCEALKRHIERFDGTHFAEVIHSMDAGMSPEQIASNFCGQSVRFTTIGVASTRFSTATPSCHHPRLSARRPRRCGASCARTCRQRLSSI